MKILKKSKSLNTRMHKKWLKFADSNHFWMIWRFKVLMKNLKNNKIDLNKGLKVMDLGCGNGVLSDQLEKKFNTKIDRVDTNQSSLKLNKNAKGRLICYNINEKERKLKNFYDIIIIFDVLEHIKNDKKFLNNTLFHLKKKGFVILNAPSINELYSQYDISVGHIKRYSKEDFKKLVYNLKINIISINFWGIALVPLLIARKFILFVKSYKDNNKIINLGWGTTKYINHIMKIIMNIELNFFPKPFLGTSIIVFLKK